MQGVMAKDAPSELPVKQIMAELLLETAALVARLNAMQDRIEGENDWAIKVRRKAEWKEERDVSVARLNKIVASVWKVLEEGDKEGGKWKEEMASSEDEEEEDAFEEESVELTPKSKILRMQTDLFQTFIDMKNAGFVRAANIRRDTPPPLNNHDSLKAATPLPSSPARSWPRAKSVNACHDEKQPAPPTLAAKTTPVPSSPTLQKPWTFLRETILHSAPHPSTMPAWEILLWQKNLADLKKKRNLAREILLWQTNLADLKKKRDLARPPSFWRRQSAAQFPAQPPACPEASASQSARRVASSPPLTRRIARLASAPFTAFCRAASHCPDGSFLAGVFEQGSLLASLAKGRSLD